MADNPGMSDTNVIGDDFEFRPTLGFVFTLDYGVATLSSHPRPMIAMVDRRTGAVSVFHHTVDTDRLVEAVTQYRIRKAIEADRASRPTESPASRIQLDNGEARWSGYHTFAHGMCGVVGCEDPYVHVENADVGKAIPVPLEAARLAIAAFDAKQELPDEWRCQEDSDDYTTVYIAESGSQVYIEAEACYHTPAQAREIARALNAAAFRIEHPEHSKR